MRDIHGITGRARLQPPCFGLRTTRASRIAVSIRRHMNELVVARGPTTTPAEAMSSSTTPRMSPAFQADRFAPSRVNATSTIACRSKTPTGVATTTAGLPGATYLSAWSLIDLNAYSRVDLGG